MSESSAFARNLSKNLQRSKKVVNFVKTAKFQAERDLSPAIGDVSNVTFDLPDTFDACKVASTIVTIADEHLSAIHIKLYNHQDCINLL